MALSRRFTQRSTGNIWPGFVDAMTALLLVLMFVLTIFMVIQSVLSERIVDQDTELDELTLQLSDLADALGLERSRANALSAEVNDLTATVDEAEATARAQSTLIATLTAQVATRDAEIANRDARITAFEDRVAALLADNAQIRADAAALGDRLTAEEETNAALQTDLAELEAARDLALSEKDALSLALARLREEIDVQAETARLAAARTEALEALVADLQGEGADKDRRLVDLLAQLEGSQAGEAELAAELEAARASEAALNETLDAARASETELEAELQRAEGELDAAEAARLAELAAAEALRQRLNDTGARLDETEAARLAEAAAAEALRARLENADAELTAMSLALEERRREAEDTLTLLAAAQSAREDLERALAEAESSEEELNERLSEAARRQVLLNMANRELDTLKAQSAEDARRVAVLNEQVAALRTQLGGLQALLDEAEARDVSAQVQIQSLGSQLNTALAQVAAEQRARADLEEAERLRLEAEAEQLKDEAEQLALYRSEFFGRLRDLLGGQEGVRIEGDRFVFSSEVLFETGEVDLSFQGQLEVAKVARILQSVAGQIPPELDWVIRVDGHTDNVPLVSTGKYADNWELSQGRALSVVRYMINGLGIPPDRLAATGFGEYQPLDPADTPEARAQNRRIELKFTEK